VYTSLSHFFIAEFGGGGFTNFDVLATELPNHEVILSSNWDRWDYYAGTITTQTKAMPLAKKAWKVAVKGLNQAARQLIAEEIELYGHGTLC